MQIRKEKPNKSLQEQTSLGLRIVHTVTARETSDGAGVRLKRSLGSHGLSEMDPFLLLDEFKSDVPDDYIAGFPDHPHRGFETVTYMLAGVMQHRDSLGNAGLLSPGGLQWMTAGKGIIHSEMPRQVDGLLWGFQLWVNLPADQKMSAPRYQDIPPQDIPILTLADGTVLRVIAGRLGELRGPVEGVSVDPLYLDIQLPAGKGLNQEVPAGHRGMVYVYAGEGHFGEDEVVLHAGQLGVVGGTGKTLAILAGASGLRLLLIAGKPIGEPVARYGPFVMNTSEEIRQAVDDFRQ